MGQVFCSPVLSQVQGEGASWDPKDIAHTLWVAGLVGSGDINTPNPGLWGAV